METVGGLGVLQLLHEGLLARGIVGRVGGGWLAILGLLWG